MQSFHFSRRERQGVAVLILFVLAALFLPEIPLYSNPTEEVKPLAVSAVSKGLAVEKATVVVRKTSKKRTAFTRKDKKSTLGERKNNKINSKKEYLPKKKKTAIINRVEFDPNTASKATLIQVGIPAKVAQTIENYRKKNGKFYKKEDLKKIYGIKPANYEQLASFIKIKSKKKSFPQRKPSKPKNYKTPQDSSKLKRTNVKKVLSLFNPNTASEAELKSLGLSEKVIRNMLKYRSKGGTFYRKEQMKKVYGLNEETYKELESYIDLPAASNNKKSYPKKEATIVEINAGSAEAFQGIRGIGPSYSKRIVKFRNALGGFHSIEQIGETWGLPDSTFQLIKPFLKMDSPANIKQISLNEADLDILKAHPYINWKKATIIMNYKKQHGDFESIEGLKEIRAISEDLFAKIAPYLKL